MPVHNLKVYFELFVNQTIVFDWVGLVSVTSESDPRRYEATKAVAKKAQKKNAGFKLVLFVLTKG